MQRNTARLLTETPPRTRRKHNLQGRDNHYLRNTSAYAEKTCRTVSCTPYREKHLRVRGENSRKLRTNTKNPETPPRTRRKPIWGDDYLLMPGNTSAYAEKTFFREHCRELYEKHLRVRGENSVLKCCPILRLETPPRTRRKHQDFV